MNVLCPDCNALHFESEKLAKYTLNQLKFGMCCSSGKDVNVPLLNPAPNKLNDLLSGNHPKSESFKKNIRQYNAAFAFTSLGVKIDHAITNAPGPYCFRIHGELCHHSGALLPQENQPPIYAQLHIYDEEEQLRFRINNNPNLDPAILAIIQDALYRSHPYVNLYKNAQEVCICEFD